VSLTWKVRYGRQTLWRGRFRAEEGRRCLPTRPVGKAGGLTVSETMAAGRPMAIVGTVPGNETFNEELVVRGGAGYAARALDVGRVVQAMRSRGEIAAMGERARGLVVPDSADRVVDVALGLAGRRAAREQLKPRNISCAIRLGTRL